MPHESKTDKKIDILKNALFDVEHALGMYAYSFCTIPAEGIYDKDALAPLMKVIESCHIYLIGYTPIVNIEDATQKDNQLHLHFTVGSNKHTLSYDLPPGASLQIDGDNFYVSDGAGRNFWPNELEMQQRIAAEFGTITFQVKYIGQAYGQDGSRNAVDRLLKHETLQKIALKGTPVGQRITLLLLEIQPNNQLFTSINPFAQNKEEGNSRIQLGLDKLFNTTEAERISLYEAALIRYFYPEFNKEFKDSFPSTNLKILQDCYKKDFSAVIAEICIDDLPFRIFSEEIKPAYNHIAKHDLHKDEGRRMFFGL
jgi:hypothetical protein